MNILTAKLGLFIVLIMVAFFTNALMAAEVDNFQSRYSALKDEKDTINLWANQEFKRALRRANRGTKHCNETKLYRSLKRSFKNHYTDHFTKRLYLGHGIVERKIPFKSSIYREFDAGDSIVIGLMAKVYDSASPIVNYNSHQIGTDKFEHFFGRGLAYYNMIHKDGKTVIDALNYGLSSEQNFLGAVMTGIMSFGDLASNFRGLFFWNHVLMKYADPLDFERPSGPYASCQNGKWIQNTTIDFSIYIDDSWDESMNCSKFRTQELANKVAKIQRQYEELDPGHRYTCPTSPDEAKALYMKFGQYAPWVFNLGPLFLK